MKLARTFALVPVAAALLAFGSTAQAQWSYSFSDMGVNYTLTDYGGSSTNRTFSLLLDTRGYNHSGSDPSLAYLDSVNIKAWTGSDISFSMFAAPGATSAWSPVESPISSGPVSNTGCDGSGGGFACAEAISKGTFAVLSGSSYFFGFDVTLNSGSFLTSFYEGGHIGAGYANASGEGSSYGITSHVAPIPEPETYAMLLAGLGLLGFHARRRKLKEAALA